MVVIISIALYCVEHMDTKISTNTRAAVPYYIPLIG